MSAPEPSRSPHAHGAPPDRSGATGSARERAPLPPGWVQRAVVRALARLPAGALVRLSGEPAVVVDGAALDPQLQLLRALRRRLRAPGYCDPTVAAGRARLRSELAIHDHPRVPVGAVRDLTLPGGAGAIAARHYAPPPAADGAPAPLLVYLHGGGFTVGDLETHDQPCRILCRGAATHVLAVDYRLAPEHPFPAALDDAHAALRWAHAHAAALGADARRVTIGGDSAGGNLAAVVAQETAGTPHAPAAQLLIYPVTDSGPRPLRDHPSRRLFATAFFLDERDRDAFAHHYLHGAARPDGAPLDLDPRVSPLRAAVLPPLAPALVVTAGFDILRDEGEGYAERLRASGTAVRGWREGALGHGFVNMTGVSRAARRATERIAREWRALVDALG